MIPHWTASGLLPPIRPGQHGHSIDRSPYKATMAQIVERLCTTEQRQSILQGFLAYRAELHRIGIRNGFQWINGSFLQDVERTESRDPRDIDVVTFLLIPDGETQLTLESKYSELFDKDHVKERYLVDAYSVALGTSLAEYHVRQISYWYSIWSHRRDGTWKGFIQVALDRLEDLDAGRSLKGMGGMKHD